METNRFGNAEIHLPEQYKEFFHRYCLTRTEGSRNNPEDSPFPRMVDMWFLALCIAIKENLQPLEKLQGKTYKAIEGAVFGSDPWRSNAIMLIAIAYSEDINIAGNPNEMLRIANGYALAGLPNLIEIVENRGGDTALDYLSDEIEELILK